MSSPTSNIYTPEQVSGLASSIYESIGSPTSKSITFISGWLTSSLGQLNLRLTTNFVSSGGSIVGGFSEDEAAIYSMMYKADYFEEMALTSLTTGGISWTNMREGDTSISRESSVKISKAYLDMHNNAKEDVFVAVADYKRGVSEVQCVDSENSYAAPSP